MGFASSPDALAAAWSRVKAYGIQPSTAFSIADPFVAYAVDAAVARWGMAFEAAMQEAGKDKKDPQAQERARATVLRRWLPSERRYATPN